MYIIIGGGGMVGGGLARRLIENKHDVVLIDEFKEVCDRLYAETGVIAINGSVARIEVLKEAGVEKADAIVAATANDVDNLACAILARSLDVPRIIVRMRDPAYENAYRVAGVNTIVRVTDMMVNEIIMDIENPRVRRVTTIGGGRANIFQVLVPEGARVGGKSVKDIAESQNFPAQCDFIAVYNQKTEEFAIPRGGQVINEGDELFLISPAESINEALDFLTAKNPT
ncbi:MAG: potassium channel family protein [Planctomycetota bacterium]|jgi:trk system potassium uptake protein TrkA